MKKGGSGVVALMVEAVRLRGCSALWFALHSGYVSERKRSPPEGLDLRTNEDVTDLRAAARRGNETEPRSGEGERSSRRNETAADRRWTHAGDKVPNGQA